MGNTDAVQALETATQIIAGLEELDGEATIADLTEHLPLAKSTVYKHLNTLLEHDLIVKSGDRYRFGLQFLELGGIARQYDRIYEVAKPEVRKMAAETGEVANLAFEEGGWGRYVYTAAGEQAVDIDTHVGKRMTLHSTALGKALLASLPDGEFNTLLAERELRSQTEQTITDPEELREEIASIRREGIAYDTEEHLRGMGCVAAPIQIPGRRHASISITGPVSRVTPSNVESEYTNIVKEAINIIELNISTK